MSKFDGYRLKSSVFKDSDKLYHSQMPYEDLPTSIKMMLDEKEYEWLSHEEKARLIETECLPEYWED